MKLQHEHLANGLSDEIDAFMHAYFARTNAQVDLPTLDLSWSLYHHLDDAGKLAVFTARDDDGKLMGFVMYVLAVNPHHSVLYTASCDTIAVDPDHRGKGIGRTLYLFAESRLIDMDIKQVVHHYRTVYDEKPMFPRLGFKLVEHVYAKEIG
jgi:GNAT superfamily N-acetyltransferase